jgi:hypothetical protein
LERLSRHTARQPRCGRRADAQPLALIEVGASAGLCLLPDRYGYDYGRATFLGKPMLRCAVNDATPIPAALPQIVWRAGLDLNPVDLSDAAQIAWLETLIGPEQIERLANLRAAIKIAAANRPRIVEGDLLGDSFARLCDEAPKDATLVIFHTAVLAYVGDLSARETFGARAMQHGMWKCPACFLTSRSVPRCAALPAIF